MNLKNIEIMNAVDQWILRRGAVLRSEEVWCIASPLLGMVERVGESRMCRSACLEKSHRPGESPVIGEAAHLVMSLTTHDVLPLCRALDCFRRPPSLTTVIWSSPSTGSD